MTANQNIFDTKITKEKCFKTFDKKNQNKIDFSDFSDLCNQLFHTRNDFNLEKSKILEIFIIFDKNNDNFLDIKEFDICWTKWISKILSPKSALLIIDVQNDFISGSLALCKSPAKEKGEEIIKPINKLITEIKFDFIAYSLDWHPKNHISFIENVKIRPIDPTCPITQENAKVFDEVIFQIKKSEKKNFSCDDKKISGKAKEMGQISNERGSPVLQKDPKILGLTPKIGMDIPKNVLEITKNVSPSGINVLRQATDVGQILNDRASPVLQETPKNLGQNPKIETKIPKNDFETSKNNSPIGKNVLRQATDVGQILNEGESPVVQETPKNLGQTPEIGTEIPKMGQIGTKIGNQTEILVRQKLWPAHAVENTWGAELHKDLKIAHTSMKFFKGKNPEVDSYSVFFDNLHDMGTDLYEILKEKNISDVFFVGLAWDYCVGHSALDALELGFRTILIQECIKAIDFEKADRMKEKIIKNGGIIVDLKSVNDFVEGKFRCPKLGYFLAKSLKID